MSSKERCAGDPLAPRNLKQTVRTLSEGLPTAPAPEPVDPSPTCRLPEGSPPLIVRFNQVLSRGRQGKVVDPHDTLSEPIRETLERKGFRLLGANDSLVFLRDRKGQELSIPLENLITAIINDMRLRARNKVNEGLAGEL